MAKTTKKQEASVVTRAEKKDATKHIIRELLAVKPHKHNELIDEVSKLYTERFGGEDTENINDVKGRVGSVLDIMKKESDVIYDNGMYALKARGPVPAPASEPEAKPVKKTRAKAKKEPEPEAVKAEEIKAEVKEEKPAKKTAKAKTAKEPKAKTAKAKKEEKAEPLPAAPLQPIAPVAPVTPEVAPEPIPEKEEEKPAPKKRGRAKAKTEEVKEVKDEVKEPAPKIEAPAPKEEEVKKEEPKAEQPAVKNPPAVKEKAEVAKKSVVMDMSFLFGDVKPAKAEKKEEAKPLKTEQKPEKSAEAPEEKKEAPKTEEKPVQKAEPVKPALKAEIAKPAVKAETRTVPMRSKTVRKPTAKPMTADEKLCDAYLKRMRSLGGDYFEYYSVYLLERYSMKNGRRLEGMRVCGGDHDGGIDGEIELTDKFGFKETIYIQSKNWDPDKGDERLWVVGETLLQQFIGACACKQAKDGKQHCRGIFVTTSRFTPDAKHILETMSDKIVGYDGTDLYEAAKECGFGVIKKNGEWMLDETLLSGTKAFFNMF